MDNNPLFDLAKLRCDVFFHSEDECNYKNEFLYYLIKNLWKIKLQKSEKNKVKYYYFEYSEKKSNDQNTQTSTRKITIPSTCLLSNSANFYVYVLFLFDDEKAKNKAKIYNILSHMYFSLDLSHLLIFYHKKIDPSSLLTDVDKKLYDTIQLWEPDKISSVHENLVNSLTNIMDKYKKYISQITSINPYFKEVTNKNNSKNDNYSNFEEAKKNIAIDDLFKSLEIVEGFAKLGKFDESLEFLNFLSDGATLTPKEQILFTETKIIIKFISNYNNGLYDEKNQDYDSEYNVDIVNHYFEIIEQYRNIRQYSLMINCYLRLIYYLTYDKKSDDNSHINEIINRLLDELYNNEISLNTILLVFLSLAQIYYKLNMNKKAYTLLFIFYQNYVNKKVDLDNKFTNYIEFLIRNLEKFFIINNSKFKNYYTYDYDIFLKISKIFRKANDKPVTFCIYKKNDDVLKQKELQLYEEFKSRRIEKEERLSCDYIYNGFNQIFRFNLWESIQKKILSLTMKYYKNVKDYDKTILYCLELLEISNNILSEEKQKNIIYIINTKSSKTKKINYYNVVNIPVITKIIPQRSEIKFDLLSNYVLNPEGGLFLFNPWNDDKKLINYYWTVNSINEIIFNLYNPLKIVINLTQVRLIYNSKNKLNIFSYLPCSITIQPQQFLEYKFKFKPLFEDTIDIIGIEYVFEGLKIKQYIKHDGNGILSEFKNRISSISSTKVKDKISLNNIRIYPEIPQLKLIPLNNELLEDKPLSLYEYQKYIFNFDILNISDKVISEFNVFVYAYKKDDYKITLQEITLKELLEPMAKKNYRFEYIQKKSHKFIEFRFYFSDVNSSCNKSMKPFLFFKKILNCTKLFKFSEFEYKPIYTNVNLKKILNSEKSYAKYFTNIISNLYYIQFDMELLQLIDKKITYKIFGINNNNTENTFIKKNKFRFFMNKTEKYSNNKIIWKIPEMKIRGEINGFDLLVNVFNQQIEQNFIFDIIKKVDEENESIEFTYKIKNNTKLIFNDMKMKILLYQEDTNGLNMNIALLDDIFIDGRLIYTINEIKVGETIEIKITVYPEKTMKFSTSFILIDQKLRTLYIPSFSIEVN